MATSGGDDVMNWCVLAGGGKGDVRGGGDACGERGGDLACVNCLSC